jgi:hypothetical protein
MDADDESIVNPVSQEHLYSMEVHFRVLASSTSFQFSTDSGRSTEAVQVVVKSFGNVNIQ